MRFAAATTAAAIPNREAKVVLGATEEFSFVKNTLRSSCLVWFIRY